ncbi:hypothetical protein Trydic_g950 [Trypoxylus dichotomus]
MKAVLLFVAALAALTSAEYTRYDGYKTYLVTPTNIRDLRMLNYFISVEGVDFWNQIRGVNDPVSVMVAPNMQKSFVSIMEMYNTQYEVLIENVESTMQAERLRQSRAPKVENGRISFTAYQRYGVIQEYLYSLAEEYPDIVTVEAIGRTYENRELTAIRIGTGSSNSRNILIDGGIHAREWIAPALALYIIQQLVENPENRALVENVNWYIIPVLNPDGYEYTHTNTRLWRKTRSRGVSCYGVDGNRNFDFQWMVVGASSNECSDTFAGTTPFSESETRAFRDYALNIENIDLYLAVHSYGQYILYPWGYTSALPDNAPQLQALGEQVYRAIYAVAGTRYTVGSSTNVLYAASGASDDWTFAVAGAPLSYTLELPGGGQNGFDLPASRILSVCQETWEGIRVFYDYVANNSR